MTRAAAAAGFAVEIFIEKNEITPVRIGRIFRDLAVTRTDAPFVRQKDARETPRKFLRDFFQGQHLSGTDWAFHFKTFTKEKVITLERFDDEEVDREPNRAAPVRIAAEKVTRSLARDIIDPIFFVAHTEDVRFVAMDARD